MEKYFSGITVIPSLNIECYFSTRGFVITLIPKEQTDICKLKEWAEDFPQQGMPEWLNGITDDGTNLFIELTGGISYTLMSSYDIGAIKFTSRFIIESKEFGAFTNLKFDELIFWGGEVNLINPVAKAINQDFKGISYDSPEEYRKSWDVEVNGMKFQVINDILVKREIVFKGIPDLKNNINSRIIYRFNEKEEFVNIPQYYDYMETLLTFLTRKHFHEYKIQLTNEYNVNGDNWRKAIAEVYVNKGRIVSEIKPLEAYDVIKIDRIEEEFPSLFALLNDVNKAPQLRFLSENSDEKKYIKYTQITDISASIEWEYHQSDKGEDNEKLKKESKKFAKKLVQFINQDDVDAKIKDKVISIIQSNLNNYKPSFREIMEILYYKYKDGLECVAKDRPGSLEAYDKEDFLKKLKSFKNMRNMATHHQFKWEDGTDIFTHLMIIVYFSIFNRAGIDQDKATECIRDGFFRIF
ncbi:hypothetical protein [Veillonella sp. DNF00869]|uniref:hypothetical protein n=1 Tax=Veillonella sp. DNF00869 TaxID=1384081 RepID=UPI000785BE59|nr:hypothetical protein [Veillonella sp. DNF00869]KXB89288.1 hypothetical protein HMPREF3032_00296 [Veillonella sp. DNF00869]